MANEQQQAPAPAPRFRYAPEGAAVVARGGNANNPRRHGLIALCIGASRIMRGADHVKRQYTARELKVEAARAQRDGRQLTVGLTCFECHRTYPTQADFDADHTQSQEDMKQHDISHTWCYWCEDKYDPNGVENIDALTAEIKALQGAIRSGTVNVAQQKDVESMIKERDRVEKLKTMLEDARRKKLFEEENIIGFLSETPYA